MTNKQVLRTIEEVVAAMKSANLRTQTIKAVVARLEVADRTVVDVEELFSFTKSQVAIDFSQGIAIDLTPEVEVSNVTLSGVDAVDRTNKEFVARLATADVEAYEAKLAGDDALVADKEMEATLLNAAQKEILDALAGVHTITEKELSAMVETTMADKLSKKHLFLAENQIKEALLMKQPFNEQFQYVGQYCSIATKEEMRHISKENILWDVSEVVEKLEALGAEEETVTAVAQLLISRGGSFLNKDLVIRGGYVEMSSLAVNNDPALKTFIETYVVSASRKKMKQYGIYNISAEDLMIDSGDNYRIHVPERLQVLQTQSESVLLNRLTVENEVVGLVRHYEIREEDGEVVPLYRKAKAGEVADRVVSSAENVLILSADGNIKVFEEAVKNGLYLNGQKYSYLLSSTSQKRQIKATFVREDYGLETVAHYRVRLGITAKDFMNPETGIFDLKAVNRYGLVSSSTTDMDKLNAYLDAPMTINPIHGGMTEIIVHAKNEVKFLIVPDVTVGIEKGEANALDVTHSLDAEAEGFKKANSFFRSDAKTLQLTQDLSDGGCLMDPELFNLIERSVGYSVGAVQFRETRFSMKGMINKVRTRAKTGYHAIIPMSVFKGQFGFLGYNEHARMNFRLAGQPRKIGKEDKYTNLPNQVLSAISLPEEISNYYAEKQLERYRNIMTDEKAAAQFVSQKLVNMRVEEGLTADHKDAVKEDSITHTASRFILENPAVIKDAYIRKSLYMTFDKELKQFARGQFEVPGNYKFMTDDILLFLDVVTHNLKSDEEGQITYLTEDIAKEHNFNYIPSGRIMLMNHTGKSFIKNKEALLLRMPLAHKGETVVAKTCVQYNYVDQLKYSGMEAFGAGMVIFSAFDFNAFAMGGGDFDGDRALVILEKRIVKHVVKYKAENDIVPILDFSVVIKDDKVIEAIEGCPWTAPAKDLKLSMEIPGLIQLQDKNGVYTNKFKVDEENYSLQTEVLLGQYTAYLASQELEGNDIGKYTNYALTIEDAISHANSILKTEEAKKYTEKQIAALQAEVEKLEVQLGLVLMALKYDLDRAKHGGAFEEYLDLSFLTENLSTLLCEYTAVYEGDTVKYVPFVNKYGKRKMKKLVWLQGIEGVTRDNFLGLIEELRNVRVLTNSVMGKQMVYNNIAWDSFVTSEEGQELFNPRESNLLLELSGFALNSKLLNYVGGFANHIVGLYYDGVKKISQEAERQAELYARSSFEAELIRDKYFGEQYANLVAWIEGLVDQEVEKNSNVFGYDIALAVSVYQSIYSSKSRFSRNEEAADAAVGAKAKLEAYTSGLAAPFMIVQKQMVKALNILGDTEALREFNAKAVHFYYIQPNTVLTLDVMVDDYFRDRALGELAQEDYVNNAVYKSQAKDAMTKAVEACLVKSQGVLKIETEVHYFGEVAFEVPVVKFNGISTPLGGVTDANRSEFLSLKGRQLGVRALRNAHHSFVKMEVVVL